MIKIGYINNKLNNSIIECELISPPQWEELDYFINKGYDLFLIDNELDQEQAKVNYRGSTIAAEIRARLPDCPIVLIIHEPVSSQFMRICDELIRHDQDLNQTQQLLISLVDGFHALRNISSKTWQPLLECLGVNQEEADLLREAAPPLQQSEWVVAEAAYWIRNVVLKFPGFLYNPIYAATRLGISLDSFQNDNVQEIIEPARYTGIFTPSEGRWWKGRLFSVAKELAIDEGVTGPINQAFAHAFHKRYNIELSPSICVWDGMPIADWVCYILHQPVKLKHSLRYYPDSRPSVMEHARVSFRAIRESNAFEEEQGNIEDFIKFP